MSQINNVITTEFRVRGGNQVTATMGSMAGGFANIGRQINETTRLSDKLNQQFRAIGTTIRYSIAGAAVFGLRGVFDQLKQIQVQMGLISAIGTIQTPGGGTASITGNNLTNLMNQTRQGAVDAITPLQDYNDAVINLLSTVQNVPEDKITPIVTTIAQAARLSQVSAEDATKAFTTMNVAFGRQTNLKNIKTMAQEFFILTQQAPGGRAAGGQLIGQLGQLAAVTRAAGGTPEDIFSLLLSGLRGGIPPSQLGRGLQFLVQTVAFPGQQSKDAQAALRSVGITPTANLTLQQRLGRVFGRARQLGMTGNLKKVANLDEDTLATMEESGTTSALQSMGIRGRGAQYLGQVFHRIHALRTAIALEGQINVGQAQADFKVMTDAANGHVADVNKLSKAWDRFSTQAKLEQASIAISAMGQQVAAVFAPVLNFPAKKIVDISGFLGKHQHDTSMGAWAGLGALLGLGTAKFFGIGPGRLLRGATGVNAAVSAMTGGGGKTIMNGLGASPESPIFVYVVGTIGGIGAGGGMGTGGRAVAAETGAGAATGIRGALATGGRAATGRAITTAGRVGALRAAGIGAGAALAVPVIEAASVGFHPSQAEAERRIFEYAQSSPEVAARYARKEGFNLTAKQISRMTRGGFQAGMFGGPQAANRAEEIRNQFNPKDPVHIKQLFRTAFENINGKAYVTLDVNLQHPGGRIERKKVVIPLDLWSGGRNPSTKGGKTGSRK